MTGDVFVMDSLKISLFSTEMIDDLCSYDKSFHESVFMTD
jgi:hypothetical protein